MEKEKHVKTFGNFNDFPPNWHEITEREFLNSKYFVYTPKLVEFRQMYRNFGDEKNPIKMTDKMVTAHLLFFFDDTGVALVKGGSITDSKLQFFAFYKCKHKMVELSQKEAASKGIYHAGMCYHVMVCTYCGFVHSYDSSG